MAKDKKITLVSAILLIVWIAYPIVVMYLNAFNVSAYLTYQIWYTILYFIGGAGMVIGGITLCNLKKRPIPIYLMALFGIWCILCSAFAEHKAIAFFGFSTMKDNFTTYFAYAGFILLGLTVAKDKEWVKRLATVFLFTSAILAVIALMDNKLTTSLCVNYITNCYHYQSVFYNTNHYGYYLLMSIILAAYLFLNEEDKQMRIIYLVCEAIFTTTLILNNTMGAYLATLLTFIFAIIWSFMNKEPKKDILIFVAVFLVATAISFIYTNNVSSNFVGMFSDAGDMMTEEDINAVGSGRGALWLVYTDVIKHYPIMGVGPENVGTSAHNTFLQIGAYTGLVGLVIYVSIFIAGVIGLIRIRHTISPQAKAAAFIVVGYLISAFFGVTMFYTAPYFYAILGICLYDLVGEKAEESIEEIKVEENKVLA